MWRRCRSSAARCLTPEVVANSAWVKGPCTLNGSPTAATASALPGSSSECRPYEKTSAAGASAAMRSRASASESSENAPVETPMSEWCSTLAPSI